MKEQMMSNDSRVDVLIGKWVSVAAHVWFTWLARLKAWFKAALQRFRFRKKNSDSGRRMNRKKGGEEEGFRLDLIQEIEMARREWAAAQQKFDYVVEQDQIDYAIYCLEAAEKRYEMLLRQAKKSGLSILDTPPRRARSRRQKQ